MEGKIIDEKKSKLNIDEIKIEYKGKIYSFGEAINENIISYQEEWSKFYNYMHPATTDKEGYCVEVNDAILITGGCKITLDSNDFIRFNKDNDLEEIYRDKYSGQVAIVDNKKINLQSDLQYFDKIEDKTYIILYTNDKVEAILEGQKVYLTERVIVDIDSGKIVGGYLCPKDSKSKDPLFSCNINDNNIVVEDGKECFVFTKDGKVDYIILKSSPKKLAIIQHNGKEIFIPKETTEQMSITKIDNTVFPDNKKTSGVNFHLHPNPRLIKTDIDSKYANAGILNLQLPVFPNKKIALKDDIAFDYTIYNNGLTLIKHYCGDKIYTINKPNNSKTYQLINKYIIPEDKKIHKDDEEIPLYDYYLKDKEMLDFIDINKETNDNKNVNNQPVDSNKLSKSYSNKGIEK